MMRMRGIPSRYVSGYLMPKSNSAGAGIEDVIGGQASHAWMEALLPGFGWIGLDPTLGEPIGPLHVHVAHGRDYADVAPVRGVYKGHAGQQLFVDVALRPSLDDDGQERLQETAAAPPPAETFDDGQVEQGQQQQQQ
jgi:transglutaminase-like putative cysteine protease